MKPLRGVSLTSGAVMALGLLLTACSGQSPAAGVETYAEAVDTEDGTPGGSQAAVQEPRVLDAWVEVRPEPNVRLQLRDGWSAKRKEDGRGPIIMSGPDAARVVVWPMFVASSSKMPTPAAVLTDFAGKEGSGITWGKPSPFGENGVRMFGEAGDILAQASFVHTRTEAGMVGYWYLTSAPRARYAELRPIFSGLMKGVQISGAPDRQAASPAPIVYTPWREPKEAAYTAEVPAEWRVSGGIIRPSPLRLLDIVEMTSPDGKAYAFSGDPNMQLYKTLTQMEAQLGMVEGMRNGDAVLMRYKPALEMIPNFVQQRLGPLCPGLKLGRVAADPQLAAEANSALRASTMPGQMQQVDVATAEFSCADAVGLVQMATYITGQAQQYGVDGFGIWFVSSVTGFIAPRERAAETGQVLIHALQSRKVNPAWTRANQEMVAQINTISRQAADDMSARIAARYSVSSSTSKTASASLDDLNRQWQNNTMDQTDVVDQATGQSYKVDSGASYYWINGAGTAIRGTDAPSQPSVDYNLMTQLP